MQSNFTIETDKLRIIYSIFFLFGSIFAVIVAFRVLAQDKASHTDDKCELKHQILTLEKQLHKLKENL